VVDSTPSPHQLAQTAARSKNIPVNPLSPFVRADPYVYPRQARRPIDRWICTHALPLMSRDVLSSACYGQLRLYNFTIVPELDSPN
jgi:hypothetical protein